MKFFNLIVTIIVFSFFAQNISAREERVFQIPNGNKYQCSNCHVSPGGGGLRTPFGETVNDNLTNGKVRWDLIFNIDSDGDGFTNGQELLDPEGQWTFNTPNPGNPNDVSKPWDPSSVPVTSSVENDKAESNTNMYPLPTSGVLNIDFPSNYIENSNIEIIDVQGNKVYSQDYKTILNNNHFKIDMTNLNISSGVYFVIIRSENYFIRKKFTYTN